MSAAIITLKVEAQLATGDTIDLLSVDEETGDDEECSPLRALDLVSKALGDAKSTMAAAVVEELAKGGVTCG